MPGILKGLGDAADGLEATLHPLGQLRLQLLAQGMAPCSPTGSPPGVARATLLRGWWHPAPTTEAATRPHLHWLFLPASLLPPPHPPFPLQLCSLGSFLESMLHQPPAPRFSGRTWKRYSESDRPHHRSKLDVDPGQQRQHSPIFAEEICPGPSELGHSSRLKCPTNRAQLFKEFIIPYNPVSNSQI